MTELSSSSLNLQFLSNFAKIMKIRKKRTISNAYFLHLVLEFRPITLFVWLRFTVLMHVDSILTPLIRIMTVKSQMHAVQRAMRAFCRDHIANFFQQHGITKMYCNPIEHLCGELELAISRVDNLRRCEVCDRHCWTNRLRSLPNVCKTRWPACLWCLTVIIRIRGEDGQYCLTQCTLSNLCRKLQLFVRITKVFV